MSGRIRTDEVQLRVLIDGSPARKELAQLDQQGVVLRENQKKLTLAANEAKKAVDATLASVKDKNAVTAEEKRAIDAANASLEKSTRELRENGIAIKANDDRMAELRKEIGLTALSVKELKAQAAILTKQLSVMGGESPGRAQLEEQLLDIQKRIHELTNATARADRSWADYRKELRLTDMSIDQLEKEVKHLTNSLRTMDPKDPLLARTRADLKATKAQLANVESGMGLFGRAWSDLKGNLLGMVGVGAAVYGAFRVIGDAIDRIKNADKALSSVKALGGEYLARITELGQAAREQARIYGTSTVETIGVVEGLAKAGVSASDILAGGLTGALTLAKAGNMDLATATEIAAKTMTQFKLQGADLPHIADLLAAGAANATGEVSDLGEGLKQSGLVMHQFKIPVEEGIGTLTAFAAAGLLGSDAGTSMRTMLLRLSNPAKEARTEMARLNISAYDAKGNFVGLSNLAGQLKTSLANLTSAERDKALATIFGSDAVRAANVLYEQGTEGINKYTTAVNQSGFAQKVASEQTNNLAGDLDKASSAWEAFVLSIENGDGVLSRVFRGAVQGFTALLDKLAGTDATTKKLEAFTARVQSQFNSIGGKGILAAEEGTGLVQTFRASAEAAVKYGNTVEDIGLLEASRNLVIEKSMALGKQFDASRRVGGEKLTEEQQVEYAAALATIEVIGEEIAKRRELLAVKNAPANGTGTDAPVAETDEERTAREAKEKAASAAAARRKEQALKDLADLKAVLEKGREELLQAGLTADEKELRQLDVKQAEERKRVLANAQHTAEDLRVLDEQQANERANLIETQGDRRAKAAADAADKVAKAEQDAKDQVFLDQLSAADKEIQAEMAKMDTLVALYEKAGVDTRNVVERTEKAIAAIRKKYAKSEKDEAVKAKQERIQQQVAIYQGVGTAIAGVNSLLAAAYTASGAANYEQTVAGQALGLAQIAIASGVGVAEAIKAGAGLPFPANLAAISTGVGAVLSGIANAIALVNSASPKQPPSSSAGNAPSSSNSQGTQLGAQGIPALVGPSHANNGLGVYDERTGERKYELEGGEAVVNKDVTAQNPALIAALMVAGRSPNKRLTADVLTQVLSPVSPLQVSYLNSTPQPINTAAVRTALQVEKFSMGGYVHGTALVNAMAPGSGHTQQTWKKGSGATEPGNGDGGTDMSETNELLRQLIGRTEENTAAVRRNRKVAIARNQADDRNQKEWDYFKDRNTATRHRA